MLAQGPTCVEDPENCTPIDLGTYQTWIHAALNVTHLTFDDVAGGNASHNPRYRLLGLLMLVRLAAPRLAEALPTLPSPQGSFDGN